LNQLQKEDQQKLTIALLDIMGFWGVKDSIKLSLLGLKTIKERHLMSYKNGNKCFIFDADLIERSKIILGINSSLATTYPQNSNYHAIWFKTKMKKFKGKTPLELMIKDKKGLKIVWHYLDCTQTWN